MRTLAIGDIHGCARALDELLEWVAPSADDLVITLGDHIDRGPDSRYVIDRLIALGRECRTVHIFGNHEEMMLDARDSAEVDFYWRMCGGIETLMSYGIAPSVGTRFDPVPPEHWRFLEQCQDVFERDGQFFVHATVEAHRDLDEQPTQILRWQQLVGRPPPHRSGKTMICGHTKQITGRPAVYGPHAICIDTWAYGDGWLTCLDVDTNHYYQTSQQGHRREADLPRPARG